MKGRDPLHAIQLIHELGLYSSIFWTSPAVLESFSSLPTDPLQGLIAATILHNLTTTPSSLPAIHPLLAQHFTLHPSTRPRLYLASALTPFKGITYRDAKDKIHPAVEAVLRDGCKLGSQNNYLHGIPTVFSGSELLKNPTSKGSKSEHRSERVAVGRSPIQHYKSHAFANFAQVYYCGINPCTTRMWGQRGLFPSCSLWYKNCCRCGGPRMITRVRTRLPSHRIATYQLTHSWEGRRMHQYV